MKKLNSGEISEEVFKFVFDELLKIFSGEIIFVAQDGYLMQVEITNRKRIADFSEKVPAWSKEMRENLKKQVLKSFSTLLYGRLVIKIQKGRVSQIDRTVQSRFVGLDGEGI
jgi:hypothetical protein